MVRTPVSILFFLAILAAFLISDLVRAAATDTLSKKLAALISERYAGTRVEIRNVRTSPGAVIDPASVEWLREDAKGVATFSGSGQQFFAEFSAWKNTFVALRRIRPGDALERSSFQVREVDVSRGLAREYRGLMLDEAAKIESFEAEQTILEGHFPLLSGVRQAPDVRRGEMVKLRLVSNGLVLSTQATASEPGQLGKSLRVMTLSTKRQLTGTLRDNGTVEVSL